MSSKGRRRVRPRPQMITRAKAGQMAGNVAIEMSIAGGQVLREVFGFDEEQVKKWIDLTVERAKKNRGEAE